MYTSKKKRLLIVAGAGASVEFGMPSVAEMNRAFDRWSVDNFSLASGSARTLYMYIHDEIADYWRAKVPKHLYKAPNFEDVLYAIYSLATMFPAGIFTSALGALVQATPLPSILHFKREKVVTRDVLHHLAAHLIDELVKDFRYRCVDRANIAAAKTLHDFVASLRNDFEISVATMNYDDLLYRTLPGIETGFDTRNGGVFRQERLLGRKEWPCIVHLHGSVHFNMVPISEIVWQDDLTNHFQGSFGRGSTTTTEGTEFPTSGIIAGYGKPLQLQRFPFRTYYSEFDRLVFNCDALLFLGYGFGDNHINSAFYKFRDQRDRPVVFVDYADNATLTACSGSEASRTAQIAATIFRSPAHEIKWLGWNHPDSIKELKDAFDFDRCTVPGRRSSIWYNGMSAACDNPGKLAAELLSGS
jgi:hypothetical protein